LKDGQAESVDKTVDNKWTHRVFLPAVGAVALALALAIPAEAGAMGGGAGSNGIGLGLRGAGRGLGLSLGGSGHGGLGLSLGARGGYASRSQGLGGGAGTLGLGAGRGSVGLGLTSGIGGPGGDDLHLGLSSRDLGLGNNFGLDGRDNVLAHAARVGPSPISPGIGRSAGDRPSLQGLDLGLNFGVKGDDRHASAEGSQTGGDGSKGDNVKKVGEGTARSTAVEEQLQLLQQSQLAAERAADLPVPPTPGSPAASTTPVTAPPAPTLPETFSPPVTTGLGSGEVQMIGAYFAQNGAPVAPVPTSSVNVSVGGTVPESVALFPPPYDLASQLSDTDFSYFVWGNNVVIVDGQTDVVQAIVPDVLAHQD
jgi:hypothetical protein